MQEQTIMQPKYGMNECMLVNRKSEFLLLFLSAFNTFQGGGGLLGSMGGCRGMVLFYSRR